MSIRLLPYVWPNSVRLQLLATTDWISLVNQRTDELEDSICPASIWGLIHHFYINCWFQVYRWSVMEKTGNQYPPPPSHEELRKTRPKTNSAHIKLGPHKSWPMPTRPKFIRQLGPCIFEVHTSGMFMLYLLYM